MWGDLLRTLSEPLPVQLRNEAFVLPVAFDIAAAYFFALTGALAAIRRGYDWVGLFALALATGLGGGLIRDGLFIQTGPPAMVANGYFVLAVVAAGLTGAILASCVERLTRAIELLDAVGLGTYGAVGVQKALTAGLSVSAAILVGIVNACGGGILRDILVREEPLVLKPGQFYAIAAALGCVVFTVLLVFVRLPSPLAALVAILVTFTFRMMAIVFKWRTRPVRPWFGRCGTESEER